MYLYESIVSRCYSEETDSYLSYGISVKQSYQDNWHLITTVHDVSPDQIFTALLAEKCTTHQLDPIHLMDVISDELE